MPFTLVWTPRAPAFSAVRQLAVASADVLATPDAAKVRIERYQVSVSSDGTPTAEVTVRFGRRSASARVTGDGGYDAFAPKIGQTFTILNVSSNLLGTLQKVEITGLAAGFQYELAKGPGTFSLVARSRRPMWAAK